MRRQRVLASTLVAVAIVGMMVSRTGNTQTPSCTGTNHCVDIVIVNGVIQHVPDVTVPGSAHWVYWTIKTNGYKFPQAPQPDGIVFKAPSSGNDNAQIAGEFEQCVRRSDVLYRCKDNNKKHGAGRQYRYEYKVNLVDSAGHIVSMQDPWVINR